MGGLMGIGGMGLMNNLMQPAQGNEDYPPEPVEPSAEVKAKREEAKQKRERKKEKREKRRAKREARRAAKEARGEPPSSDDADDSDDSDDEDEYLRQEEEEQRKREETAKAYRHRRRNPPSIFVPAYTVKAMPAWARPCVDSFSKWWDKRVAGKALRPNSDNEPLIVHRLRVGKDYASNSHDNSDMMAFILAEKIKQCGYVIGDAEAGECVLVDPVWDVYGIVRLCRIAGMEVVGVIITHAAYDTVGGLVPERFRMLIAETIQGVEQALEFCPVYVHALEVAEVVKQSGVAADKLTAVEDGHEVAVGRYHLELLHTPGYSPGSQCALLTGRGRAQRALFAGDTVVPGSFGRIDTPQGSAEQMYRSLRRLGDLEPSVVIYPGHEYGEGKDRSTVKEERKNGYLAKTRDEWELAVVYRGLTGTGHNWAFEVLPPKPDKKKETD